LEDEQDAEFDGFSAQGPYVAGEGGTVIVLGIDPGTSKRNPAGLAIVDSYGPTLLHTASVGLGSWQASAAAVYEVAMRLRDYHYEAVAYEYPHLVNNPQVAIKLAHFGGVALAIGVAACVPVVAVQPVEAKQSLTGDHRADKAAMIRTARLLFEVELSSHLADACGIALAGEAKLRVEALERIR
jgi:Holliday junction resolvasome RuvABC endonuclease subunit